MTLRRPAALGLALILTAALVLQFGLNGATPGLQPWGARLWDLLRYFTILTCGLVAVLMAREALGRQAGANWQATAVVNMLMVGVIFQILLRPPEPPTGIHWWPDFIFHAAGPVLTLTWWAVWGARPLRLAALPRWLLWPVAYCVYALIRGAFEGRYPYFFLDVGQFGATQIAINIAGLVLVFALGGLLVWGASRFLPRSSV